jgi:hypothetical protein
MHVERQRLYELKRIAVANDAASRDRRYGSVRFREAPIRSARCSPSYSSACRLNRRFHPCFFDENTAQSKPLRQAPFFEARVGLSPCPPPRQFAGPTARFDRAFIGLLHKEQAVVPYGTVTFPKREVRVIERHGLCRESAALHEVHAYIAGLEKHSRYQAPTALRIPLLASLADDLGSVVTEALAGCERGVGPIPRLLFGLLASRLRPIARDSGVKLSGKESGRGTTRLRSRPSAFHSHSLGAGGHGQ